MPEYVIKRDTPLSRVWSTDSGEARFDDVWVDREHEVTAVFYETGSPANGSRGFAELVVVLTGTGRYEIGGEEVAIGPGDFLVWPADTEAVLTPDDHLRLVAIAYPFVRPDESG